MSTIHSILYPIILHVHVTSDHDQWTSSKQCARAIDEVFSYTPFTQSKNYLNRDPDSILEDVPIYTGHSLFNTTNCITLLFIVTLQST